MKRKKDNGEIVSDLAAIMLTIIGSFCLIFAGIFYLQFTETKNNIAVAMRSTILQMEETGYLEDITKSQLKARLQGIGVTGTGGADTPVVNGTTEDSAERPKLSLTVEGSFSMSVLTEHVLEGDSENSWIKKICIPIHMTQYSVAVGYAP